MRNDRRDFFKKAAGAAATLAAGEAVRGATSTADAAVLGETRGFAAGRYGIELEGAMAGFLQSTEGGDATAEVIEEKDSEACATRKHLGNVKYEDIQISCGTGMSAAFYEWLQGVPTCEFARKNGAIVAADVNSKERARRTFTQAIITELSMPALDAADKDTAYMNVTISPESTQRQKGSGNPINPCGPVKTQKKWLASNFRLTIPGLDCSKVNKIEAFVFKQQVIPDQRGTVEVSNLVITLPESSAQSFFDWHEDFVIKGNNGSESEKSGMLEYLTPNLGEALFTLNFQHLGIFKLVPEKVEAGNEQIKRVKAEIYCEEATFQFGKSAATC
jgi:phage tail-like protein